MRMAALIPVFGYRIHHNAAKRLVELSCRCIGERNLMVAFEHQLDEIHNPVDFHVFLHSFLRKHIGSAAYRPFVV